MAGELDAAAIPYGLIEPYGDQVVWNGTVAYGHASTYVGLFAAALGRHEQADEQFAIATGSSAGAIGGGGSACKPRPRSPRARCRSASTWIPNDRPQSASTATVDHIPLIWVEPPRARAHASPSR